MYWLLNYTSGGGICVDYVYNENSFYWVVNSRSILKGNTNSFLSSVVDATVVIQPHSYAHCHHKPLPKRFLPSIVQSCSIYFFISKKAVILILHVFFLGEMPCLSFFLSCQCNPKWAILWPPVLTLSQLQLIFASSFFPSLSGLLDFSLFTTCFLPDHSKISKNDWTTNVASCL